MRSIRWEPFRSLDDFFAQCGPLAGGVAARRRAEPAGRAENGPVWAPVANVSETAGDYLIRAELPDVGRDDVRVTVDGDVITIAGERRNAHEREQEKQHRIEGFYGAFSRSFRLPEDADPEAVRAESSHGVLKVRIPKKAAARPRKVEVRVN